MNFLVTLLKDFIFVTGVLAIALAISYVALCVYNHFGAQG